MGRALVMNRGCKRGRGFSSSFRMAMTAEKLMTATEKEKLLEALQGAGSTPVVTKVSDAISDVTKAEDFFPRNPLQPLTHPCSSNAVKSPLSCPELPIQTKERFVD